ncbi:hypothetical protein [Pontibacter rugosus]|uniref:CRISPR-associated protein Cst1 n=1 Tax=Pontibacter rugosus TaxID=1745966 RepID=A0ABW3SRK3_9BACT
MKQIDFQHPYPRYGFAAALVASESFNIPEHLETWEDVRQLAVETLKDGLNYFSVFTKDDPALEATTALTFDYVKTDLNPGKASGQIAAKGYFLAPHVVTSDGSAANTVGEARLLIQALEKCKAEKDLFKPYDLKRSFAPLTSKVNNGSKSAQNPKASLRDAAFTCITTLTRFKPAVYAAYQKGSFANAVMIPDLPLYSVEQDQEEPSYPMVDFVEEFRKMQESIKADHYMIGEVAPDKKSFRRPNLHKGNYPNAPSDSKLNAVSVVAAIAEWYKQNLEQGKRAAHIKAVLESLKGRPLYIVSYEFARQERFSHHLISLALQHDVPKLQKAVWRSKIYGVEKFDDPKRQLFNLAFTHLLQLYTSTDFKNFMAYRAEYPAEFSPIFNNYFMDAENLSPTLVRSARAYGQSLNSAAYRTANKKYEEDQKAGRAGLSIDENKARILTELESRVLSAKSKPELLSQISITIGRMTGKDFYPEAGEFMEEVLTEKVSLKQAQYLITAFMRLRTVATTSTEEAKNTTVASAEA